VEIQLGKSIKNKEKKSQGREMAGSEGMDK